MNDPSRKKNWKIISSTKKNLNIIIFFDWFKVNSFKRCWRLNCLLVDSDNAKSKLYRISSTSGQCRDQVPPGGLGCGMNCTEIFLDCGQSYRTEEDGLVMESQKKNWLREVRRRQMERPRKLAEWAEWAEKRVGSTHTHTNSNFVAETTLLLSGWRMTVHWLPQHLASAMNEEICVPVGRW